MKPEFNIELRVENSGVETDEQEERKRVVEKEIEKNLSALTARLRSEHPDFAFVAMNDGWEIPR